MVTHLFMQNKSLSQIFLWPLVIGLITVLGLVTALLVDDARELLSDAAVALPIVISLYYYLCKPRLSARFLPGQPGRARK
ncbi:hypothetical protein INP77_11745 [Methylophilus sp. 13]|uniref:hypothetical protein n=1 Tax=Methylophilus sp. 13 TaxID=2781018 RepID=UPI00188FCF9F|nr:hypothetical protein [Methylophilus sp. 13]MBF5040162.1 hypothetical protein [Methylophilus sp. 13]